MPDLKMRSSIRTGITVSLSWLLLAVALAAAPAYADRRGGSPGHDAVGGARQHFSRGDHRGFGGNDRRGRASDPRFLPSPRHGIGRNDWQAGRWSSSRHDLRPDWRAPAWRAPAPWRGRFGVHDWNTWRGGHWRHDWHAGRLGWWWIVGGLWYLYPSPVYPFPSYSEPPVVVLADPAAEADAGPYYWYFCNSAQTYYPYIKTCPEGWQQVPAAPAEAPR